MLTGHVTFSRFTVYAPVGLPWQDLALTWLVHRAVVGAGRVPGLLS